MYIEELLEVSIGMVLVWLVLALAVMAVQEWIASILKWRSGDLEKAIRRMLDEPESRPVLPKRILNWFGGIAVAIGGGIKRWWTGEIKEDNTDHTLTDKLYAHPLIKALAKKPNRNPSYIPSHTFALALCDVVMTAGTEASSIKGALTKLEDKLAELEEVAGETAANAVGGLIEQVKEAGEDKEKLGALKKSWDDLISKNPKLKPLLEATLEAVLRTELSGTGEEVLEQIAKGAAELAVRNPGVSKALNTFLISVQKKGGKAEDILEDVRTGVETWFDDAMARLSGWYKRRAFIFGIILGVVFATVLNVDSVSIAATLWREPAIRQALVTKAETFQLPEADGEEVKTPAEAIEGFQAEFEGLKLPIGWETLTLTTTQTATQTVTQVCVWPWSVPSQPDRNEADRKEPVGGLKLLGECWVPLGAHEAAFPRGWGFWLPKLAGWLVSGAAAAQGAPFWFDVLKKLTNVRLAGKNPAEENKKKSG